MSDYFEWNAELQFERTLQSFAKSDLMMGAITAEDVRRRLRHYSALTSPPPPGCHFASCRSSATAPARSPSTRSRRSPGGWN